MLERLQKIIARAGIASRRHAEQLIISGQVSVNGVVVTELGAKADPERDRVEAAGKVAERPAVANSYILYKPAHVVSTMSDPEGRATLRHLLRGLSAAVFPVGRLDYAASGLVLLSSDGELADRIFKCASRIPKVYWIKVKGRPTDDLLYQIRQSAHVRMRRLAGPSAAREHSAENPWYEVELSDARSDSLRTALFAAGHPVEKLKRVRFGPLDLGDLQEGHFRQLAPSEVAQLRSAVDRAEKAPQPPRHFKSEAAKRSRWMGARKPLRIGPGGQPRSSERRIATPARLDDSRVQHKVQSKVQKKVWNKVQNSESRVRNQDSRGSAGHSTGRRDSRGPSKNRRDSRGQNNPPWRSGGRNTGGRDRRGPSSQGRGSEGRGRPGRNRRDESKGRLGKTDRGRGKP